MTKVLEFIDGHESPEYAAHCVLWRTCEDQRSEAVYLVIVNIAPQLSISFLCSRLLYNTRNMSYSSFEWNACQSLFEQLTSDTLFLFACCSAAVAASSVPSRTNAITETIAAYGWETWAPEPGRHSFTSAIIEVLEEWIDRKSFSAAMLHSEVLSVLKSTRPKKRLEISKTPIYIVTTSNPKTCSIEIRRRTQASASMNMSYAPTESCTASQASTQAAESEPAEAEDKFDLSSLVAALPDSTFALPHVIMSVALETDQKLDMHTFEQWMKDFPALARYAKIQGVYQSYSTLVLLSVPVAVWNIYLRTLHVTLWVTQSQITCSRLLLILRKSKEITTALSRLNIRNINPRICLSNRPCKHMVMSAAILPKFQCAPHFRTSYVLSANAPSRLSVLLVPFKPVLTSEFRCPSLDPLILTPRTSCETSP